MYCKDGCQFVLAKAHVYKQHMCTHVAYCMCVSMCVCMYVCMCVHTPECSSEGGGEGTYQCITYFLVSYITHVSMVVDCVASPPGRHTHQGQQCEGHLCTAGEQTDREVQRGQVPITV